MDLNINSKSLEEELEDRFFSLRIFDQSSPKVDGLTDDFPEEIVVGRFIKNMKEKIEETDEGDKSLYEDVLKIGFALLSGNDHVIE